MDRLEHSLTTRQHEQEPVYPIPYELAMELHKLANLAAVVRNVDQAPETNQAVSTTSPAEAAHLSTPLMQHKPVKGRGKQRNHERLAAKIRKLASKLRFRQLVEALDLHSLLGPIIPRLKLPQMRYLGIRRPCSAPPAKATKPNPACEVRARRRHSNLG